MAKITLSIRLEQNAIDKLDALCADGRIGRSRLIESIVDHFLAKDFLEQKRIMPRLSRKPRGGDLENG